MSIEFAAKNLSVYVNKNVLLGEVYHILIVNVKKKTF